MNSTNSEKLFYTDLQILISVLLLAATLYISGFRALTAPYFLFYVVAVIQILLLFSGYMYERRQLRTNLSDLLLRLDKEFFIIVFSSLVYIISQAMIIKVSKDLNERYTYLIPFIFSLITFILLVVVLNEVNMSDKFKFKIYPERIDIYCLKKDEDDSSNDGETSFDITIRNDSKKDSEVKITILYDKSSLEVDAGTIFEDNTAKFKLSKGTEKFIGINVYCKNNTTSTNIVTIEVLINNKLTFDKNVLIKTIGSEKRDNELD